MHRRDLLTLAAAAGAAATLGLPAAAAPAPRTRERLRLGLIGVGLRGRAHLAGLLLRDDVEIAALCDIEQYMLDRALEQIVGIGRPRPRVYTGDEHAYEEMLADGRLDAVLIATPWEWHAPQSIAAMKAGIPVGCEVVAGITLDDHWDVLRTQRRTGTPYMLLENVCYRRDVLAVLQMVRQGLFGELLHVEGGYQHDLRADKFNSGEPGVASGGGVEFGAKGWSRAKWRTAHSVRRNGDLYPNHGVGPAAMWLGINRGNRFTRLTSYASQARGLHKYVVEHGGAAHPNAKVRFRLGDVVTTQIACAGGQTVLLTHDTSSPRPYSLGFRVQGTEGLWMDVNGSIYFEDAAAQPHQWEPAQPWLERHDHPLWRRYAERAQAHGHGGMDFFVLHAFVEALKRGAPMPIDVLDAVTWSAISPLSERSIAQGNAAVEFPDFSQGRWDALPHRFALDDEY